MTIRLPGQKTKTDAIPTWGRPFALVMALLFLISSLFPVAAALSTDTSSFPTWWGALDVSLAFALAIMTFVIYGLAHGKVSHSIEGTTYHAYRILIHGIFVLLVAFLLLGDRINWISGLPGIGWRAWLLFLSCRSGLP
jgi:hypothetical protein